MQTAAGDRACVAHELLGIIRKVRHVAPHPRAALPAADPAPSCEAREWRALRRWGGVRPSETRQPGYLFRGAAGVRRLYPRPTRGGLVVTQHAIAPCERLINPTIEFVCARLEYVHS